MRAVLQRVTQASVTVHGECVGSIPRGLLILLGVARSDNEKDVEYLAEKITHLRIFEDEGGKMNRSLLDVGGAILAVSQFTLYGDCRRGRRPSFDEAAAPEQARNLYQYFVERMKQSQLQVETGVFQAEMLVSLTNDGPVTLILDSKKV